VKQKLNNELQFLFFVDHGNVDESCLDVDPVEKKPSRSSIESKTKFSLTRNLFNYAKLQKKAKYVFDEPK